MFNWVCPLCQNKIENLYPHQVPTPGDVVICLECSAMLVHEPEKLRPINTEELDELLNTDLWCGVQSLRANILKRRNLVNRFLNE